VKAAALLLAAGRGRRAGGPKAWLQWEGLTLLERQLRFLCGHFEAGRIAISIQEPWLARARALDGGVRWTPVDPDAPMLAAVQALLRAAGPGPAFLHHVDMPVWEAELFEALDAAARAWPAAAACMPVHAGRRGHPVLLTERAAADVLALDPARDRLDAWLRTARAREVPVDSPCVLENWNAGPPARAR
jgi:CTP:molybdopterin cytidylyltransferase MocA